MGRAHVRCAEALPLPRGLGGAFRRACTEPWAVCHRSMRVCQIQAPWRSRCARAYYGVVRFVMESGAKGCEVTVSGKLRAQRAKAMKFKDGYFVSSGQPAREYVDKAVRHVLMRQGVLGIKVSIMLHGILKARWARRFRCLTSLPSTNQR